jgi:hypothetical protein
MKYTNYRYLYPPRPKNAISPEDLDFWDNNTMICQPKLNGSNATIYTDGKEIIVMNRHAQKLTNVKVSDSEISSIYRGDGWMILNCEYMNKSKSDENVKVFNHKLVIFDILAYNGEYLVGSTFSERVSLLDNIYGVVNSEKDYLFSVTDNIYRVKSYHNDFSNIFNKFIKVDMLEGLVIKRTNAKLEIGTSQLNNVKSQLKCRKPTLNYKY